MATKRRSAVSYTACSIKRRREHSDQNGLQNEG